MAYTYARLVPLNKNPGVCPIGVGEVVRRIVGKAIMRVVKHDVQGAVGCILLCAGQDAMRGISYKKENSPKSPTQDSLSNKRARNRHVPYQNTKSPTGSCSFQRIRHGSNDFG